MKAEEGDYLKIHYVGRFNDENGEIFDSSRDRGQLYQFQLGEGQVKKTLNFFQFYVSFGNMYFCIACCYLIYFVVSLARVIQI